MFTYKLKLKPKKRQIKELEKRFKFAWKLKYHLVKKVSKMYEFKRNHPLWAEAKRMREAGGSKGDINKIYNQLEKEMHFKFFNTKTKEYELLNLKFLGKYATHWANQQGWTSKNGGISSRACEGVSEDVMKALEKVNYGNGKKINTNPKLLKLDKILIGNKGSGFKDGMLTYAVGKGNKYKLEIQAIMIDDDYEKEVFTRKLKTTSLQRTLIRGEYQYYAILTFEGNPPKKYSNVKGDVGIDPGTSQMAIYSDIDLVLTQLSTSNEEDFQRKLRLLQRKFDRQKRLVNPHAYAEDGTYIKNTPRKSIKYSKGMIKTKKAIAELHRLQAIRRNIEHKKLANKAMQLGDVFKVEDLSYKALQLRAKETKVSEKTGRIQRKTRFGGSIGKHAPSMFLNILKYKVEYNGGEWHIIDPRNLKPSQYNHVDNKYEKVSLTTRNKKIGNHIVQRDAYSAYLLQNVDVETKQYNKEELARKFEQFIFNHDKTIEKLSKDEKQKVKSLGLDKLTRKDK